MLRIDTAVLKARVKAVEADLVKEGLEALVVFATGSALGSGSRSHGNMRYLCNWDGHNTPSILILRPGREPTLITGVLPMLLMHQWRDLLWFKDVHHVKAPNFGQAVVSILGKTGGGRRRIGLLGLGDMPAPVWKAIEAGLPGAEWIDFQPWMDARRVIKDAYQLAFHRRAAEICDAMFQVLPREVRSGRRGYQIQAEMERTARAEGCEYCITWLTVAPAADYPRFYKEECLRVPAEGDQVIAGIYMLYEGHWGHAIRTGTVGKPTDRHRKVFDIAYAMQEAALAKFKPGNDLHEVNRAMDRALHRHYKEGEVIRSRAGHGLGFSYEDSIVSVCFPHPWELKDRPKRPAPIEVRPGMLIELHPNVFVPGVAGAMVGDMVVATEGGNDILLDFPRELHTW
ncbi:MAG: aminopeptidase P family protein [Proteobacteria bacterium]|nr:aminopeptidase P family protein [Pseudomonadota bacterium]